jgi:uncharacterized delta-60 repeat protein
MPSKRLVLFSLLIFGLVSFALMQTVIQSPGPDIVVGRNVNMVSGTEFPGGDQYLQRQNEPSMAVSTRNPLHLIAGANDYRPVNFPESEGELPGQEPVAQPGDRDAWLGVFKSFNGGQSWTSALLPGCKYDPSDPGTSPLFGFGAAADPTVRSGPNGMFYYSGIAFDRIKNGRSVYFMSRFIDNNNLGYVGIPSSQTISHIQDINGTAIFDSTDPIDTQVLYDGTSGQFADKPWIAVDKPRGTRQVLIRGDGFPDQWIPAHNVYCVFSIFLGNLDSDNVHNKILFARSTDCGNTWEHPVKLSESEQRNQGTVLAINPDDGTIYVAWRRFQSQTESDAILVCKSTDLGQTFSRPVEVTTFNPFPEGAFDQGTSETSFRTSAFPTMTVDHNGIVYVAWAERIAALGGQARIMISASRDGLAWEEPQIIDNSSFVGHQIMPSLTYAARKLMIICYDTRRSQGNHDYFIDDFEKDTRHTMDVWVAEAPPSDPSSFSNPSFSAPKQVSRYLYEGDYSEGQNVQIQQLQFNPPNYPMFMGGIVPFIGDYIDISPGPMFLPAGNGDWRFNTGFNLEENFLQEITENPMDPAIFHITWTDNRDIPATLHPSDESDTFWKNYYPPGSASQCDTTGRRDQNIYTSQISEGIVIGSPSNTKPLSADPLIDPDTGETIKRTFLIFVKNFTNAAKVFLLTIDPLGSDINASFWQFGAPNGESEGQIEVEVAAFSSATLTVFAECVGPSDPDRYASLRVYVEEVESFDNTAGTWIPVTNGFQGYVLLNPDPVNTAILDYHYEEIHTPLFEDFASTLVYETMDLSDLLDMQVYDLSNLEINNVNPDIIYNPNIRSPNIRSDLVNPNIRSPNIRSINFGQVTDVEWTFTNDGNTTSAYSFTPFGEQLPTSDEEYVESQLLIYKVHNTPMYGCAPGQEQDHHELILKIDNPNIRSIEEAAPNIRSPNIRSNTFFLVPGESAVVSLRLISQNPHSPFDPQDYVQNIGGAATPQAVNTGETEPATASSLMIVTKYLEPGEVNDDYFAILEAFGGTPHDFDENNRPVYLGWSVIGSPTGEVAPGVVLLNDGTLTGTPQYDHEIYNYPESYAHTYSFAVGLQDADDPPLSVQKTLSLTIDCKVHPITVTAGTGGKICHPNPDCVAGGTTEIVSVLNGEDRTFDIIPVDCFEVLDVIVDNDHLGPVLSHTFYGVREPHSIEAIFALKAFTITSSAGPDGSVDPSGDVTVYCGSDQTFNIIPDEGFRIEDVLVDGESEGSISEYTFIDVTSDHEIHATFVALLDWVQRYDNAPVNDDDEAADMAIDPSGNIHITGYSVGKTTGPDFYTISYDSLGNALMNARLDGPSYEGDKAHAIAVDNLGNIFVTGESVRGQPIKHFDYLTAKYNSSWDLAWDVRYDDRRNGNDVATAIAYHNGYVYVTGRSEDSESKKSDVLHYDYFTVKYDAGNGKLQWDARYNNLPTGKDEATAMVVDKTSGAVYVTGRSEGDGTGFDIVTIKYLPDGTPDPAWGTNGVVRYDGEYGDDEASGIACDSAGNVFVTGKSRGSGLDYDYVTIKYDASGAPAQSWDLDGIARYEGDFDDEAAALVLHEAGGETSVFVTGHSANSAAGTANDYVTIKYLPDGSGDPAWGTGGILRYDGGTDDRATAMAINSSGEVYITGKSEKSSGNYDYYTIKYDGAGNLSWRARYHNDPFDGNDEATAIAIDNAGHVYVTGRSARTGSDFDFATVKYKEFD